MRSRVKLMFVAAGCTAFMGCVSEPFIDDCIREMDAIPMTALLDIPDTPIVAPFAKDKLAGLWETGIYYDWCRSFVSTGLGPAKKMQLHSRIWSFDKAGSFAASIDIAGCIGLHRTVKESGRYEYENGLLTLNVQRIETKEEWTIGQQTLGGREDVHEVNRKCHYHLRWLNADEFIVPAIDVNPLNELGLGANAGQGGDSTIEGRDGSLIERSVMQTGMRDGRHVGSVSETMYAPAHFKRKR